MNIICFCPRHPHSPYSSASFVESLDAVGHIDVHRQLDTLGEALRHICIDPSIALLVAPDRETLRRLVEMQELLSGMKIVLIVPDRDAHTLALGHRLRPRYVGFFDSNPTEIHAVLARLLHASVQCAGSDASSDRPLQGNR